MFVLEGVGGATVDKPSPHKHQIKIYLFKIMYATFIILHLEIS